MNLPAPVHGYCPGHGQHYPINDVCPLCFYQSRNPPPQCLNLKHSPDCCGALPDCGPGSAR